MTNDKNVKPKKILRQIDANGNVLKEIDENGNVTTPVKPEKVKPKQEE